MHVKNTGVNNLKDVSTILISFSGGRTSGMMTYYLLNNPKYEHYKKIVLFANTGREREETLEFVRDCDEVLNFNTVWIEADISQEMGVGVKPKVVTFETASRIGEKGPFDDLIQKLGIPNPAKSGHCTRDLKKRPMDKYMGTLGYKAKDYITAIGIRADEPRRLTKRMDAFYPLAEILVSERSVRAWWKDQSFDLELEDYQGNCDLCFKKSENKILTCMSEDSVEDTQWWITHEEASEKGHTFSRANTLTRDLLKRAKEGDFNPVKDKFDGVDLSEDEVINLERI